MPESTMPNEPPLAETEPVVQEAPVASVVPPSPKPIVRLHGSASLIKDAVRKALERTGQADREPEYPAKARGEDVLRVTLDYVDIHLVGDGS
jgi:hypothetical protein